MQRQIAPTLQLVSSLPLCDNCKKKPVKKQGRKYCSVECRSAGQGKQRHTLQANKLPQTAEQKQIAAELPVPDDLYKHVPNWFAKFAPLGVFVLVTYWTGRALTFDSTTVDVWTQYGASILIEAGLAALTYKIVDVRRRQFLAPTKTLHRHYSWLLTKAIASWLLFTCGSAVMQYIFAVYTSHLDMPLIVAGVATRISCVCLVDMISAFVLSGQGGQS
jgi:hypothetical protein